MTIFLIIVIITIIVAVFFLFRAVHEEANNIREDIKAEEEKKMEEAKKETKVESLNEKIEKAGGFDKYLESIKNNPDALEKLTNSLKSELIKASRSGNSEAVRTCNNRLKKIDKIL